MEEIEYIDIDCLVDYEKQAEVYGEPEVEPEFVASVKDMGILTPLTVAADGLAGTYIIISGHRRRRAAEEAGLDAVPCIVKEYENAEMMELEFLAANMQREKSDAVRLKEFLSYKQILCQIGKVRKSKGVYADTIFENQTFMTFAKTHNLESKIVPGKPLKTVDLIKELTGFSEYEQKWLKYLEDDNFLQSKFDELASLGLGVEDSKKIFEQIELAKTACRDGAASLHEAASAVKDMFESAKKQLLAVRDKQDDKAKVKPAKAEKEQKAEKPKLTLAIEVKVKRTYSETPMKFSEADGVAEFYLRRGVATFGVVRNSGMVTGIAAEIDGKVYNINLDLLAQTLEEAI